MLYDAYELGRGWAAGATAWARVSSGWWSSFLNPLAYHHGAPVAAAALDVFAHALKPRGKPAFGLHRTIVDGQVVEVREAILDRRPFGQLKHFERVGIEGHDPVILLVAPMSGHYATLLRGTVERLLPSHEVFITDWRDAKMVPLSEGTFSLNDYIDYLIDWIRLLAARGERAHVVAVCQPSVPALAAVALMSAGRDPARPYSLTMMGGPVDTREAPTEVNRVAKERPLAWFEQNVIHVVPFAYPGRGRRIYPGFLQLAGFMAMNLGNHLVSHWEMFKHLVEGDEESAEATKAFYEEYLSVCDMDAVFYLQTVDEVFQRHLLPKGEFIHRGERVDLGAITDVALLAIEGERDDISGVGQTKAALTLARNLPSHRKDYLLVPGAGHYGIFNGRKWREIVAPAIEDFVRLHGGRAPLRRPGPSVLPPVEIPPGAEFA
ncbi:MAG: polyhydroxyalkanoate depolymerase [Sphingomonadaceae bacterium]|uniref:polyhydroxyalkanoate depolymerase n=1 Tax=Thermaurantiacus sp. TaxID=2820283 RepID=UPI00298EE43E|nr:polyhydroxyalkanoate depolymerase [Thermaurantiacus sp.]MCS6986495.1 polyhydroxyalkanoate depolymerase [Sphingomonadaceae bacterium]MDW8414244.1 polyhydroxyalkanoate depolymerase [Thermaurantiacus sp.]